MINVSEALDRDLCEDITVFRTTTGEYVDGIYVEPIDELPFTYDEIGFGEGAYIDSEEGNKTEINALASIQQPTSEDIQFITGAEKTSDLKLFICNVEVKTSDEETGQIADVINCSFGKYKIIGVKNYFNFGHTTVVGAKIA